MWKKYSLRHGPTSFCSLLAKKGPIWLRSEELKFEAKAYFSFTDRITIQCLKKTICRIFYVPILTCVFVLYFMSVYQCVRDCLCACVRTCQTALVGGPAGCGLLAVQELKGNWTEDAMWPAEPECILPKFPYAGFVSFDPNTHKKFQTNAYLF